MVLINNKIDQRIYLYLNYFYIEYRVQMKYVNTRTGRIGRLSWCPFCNLDRHNVPQYLD